jgi:hypothetical protein
VVIWFFHLNFSGLRSGCFGILNVTLVSGFLSLLISINILDSVVPRLLYAIVIGAHLEYVLGILVLSVGGFV